LDGEGDQKKFAGTVAKEMDEETGLQIMTHQLFNLTNWAYGTSYKGMYPSAGGCDEVCIFPTKKVN
jgi:ADP-sugar diphosphatase